MLIVKKTGEEGRRRTEAGVEWRDCEHAQILEKHTRHTCHTAHAAMERCMERWSRVEDLIDEEAYKSTIRGYTSTTSMMIVLDRRGDVQDYHIWVHKYNIQDDCP